MWDDGPPPALPSLDRDLRADVCVVGLGAAGLNAVIELAGRGRTVIGVDAGSVGGGASGRNGGVLRAGVSRFHHDAIAEFGADRARRLYQLTAAEIARTEHDALDAVRRVGSLRIAADDAEWADCERQLDALRADGVDARTMQTQFGRGLFIANDGALHPVARCRALARRALGAATGGARPQLFELTPVVTVRSGEVVTAGGRVSCDAVIVAVDGGLEELVPALVGTVRTTRLQMLATEPATDVAIPCPTSANYGFDYWQQLPDGRIALGGGRDRAMDREWGAPAEPTDEIQDYLDSVLRDRIGTRARVTHRWAARVAYTTSGLPILAECEPRVWAVGAYSGTGNLLGPICGREAARLACAESSDLIALVAQSTARAC